MQDEIQNRRFGDELRKHSRMANSFLGTGSVEQKQHILTKNDTYKICRSCFGLSKNSKKGGKKGGQRHLGTQEYWVRPRKSGKFWFFHSRGMKMKGGAKGVARKRGAKGGAAFPNVGSDQIYHNM